MKKFFYLLSICLILFSSCSSYIQSEADNKIKVEDLIGTPFTNPDLMTFLEQLVPEVRDGRESYHYNYLAIYGLKFDKGIPCYELNEGTFPDLVENNEFIITKYTKNKTYTSYNFRISEYSKKNTTKSVSYDSYVSESAQKILSSSRAIATVSVTEDNIISHISICTSSRGNRLLSTSRTSPNTKGITIYYKEFKNKTEAKSFYNSFTNDKTSLVNVSKEMDSCPLSDVYYCCPNKMQVMFEYPYVVAIYNDNGTWSKDKLGF